MWKSGGWSSEWRLTDEHLRRHQVSYLHNGVQVRDIDSLGADYVPATTRECTPEDLSNELAIPIGIESRGRAATHKTWSHIGCLVKTQS